MIFDTIYSFYHSLFLSDTDISNFWSNWYYDLGEGPIYVYDYISAIATAITIVLGIVALFRILGGVLKLFKV